MFRRTHRHRRGSALLICTLAATVLSMASIAILRSNRREVARVEARRAASQARVVAQGLVQRSIAMLRDDAKLSGVIADKDSPLPDAYVELRPISADATLIQVYLYAGSRIPAVEKIVDPAKLSDDSFAVEEEKKKKEKKEKKEKKTK